MTEKRAAPCAAWAIVFSIAAYNILEANLSSYQFGGRLLTFSHLLWGFIGLASLAAGAFFSLQWLQRLSIGKAVVRRLAAAGCLLLFLLYGGFHIGKLSARLIPGSLHSGGRLEDIVMRYTASRPALKADKGELLIGRSLHAFTGGKVWGMIKDWELKAYLSNPLPEEYCPALPRVYLQFTEPRYGTNLSLAFDSSSNPRLISLSIDSTHDYTNSDDIFYTYYAAIPESDLLALEELLHTEGVI